MPVVCYTLDQFLNAPADQVLGRLSQLYSDIGFSSLLTSAIDAWRDQLPILRDAIHQLVNSRPDAQDWHVLLEYQIPMRDRRPDAVILAGPAVFVLEFKVGAESHDSAAMWQVQSYALDLRDFHPECHNQAIIPILVATHAPGEELSEKALVTNASCQTGHKNVMVHPIKELF